MSAKKDYELSAWSLNQKICGIDEAGRGPLAGPCVVCGVVLRPHVETGFIDDSKKLSLKQRNEAYDLIQSISEQIINEVISPTDIDEFNIYQATRMANEKIAQQAHVDLTLTDAMPLNDTINHVSLIKGDQLSVSIACASIVAKVTRDRIMEEYDEMYPQYGFKKHKGYPTVLHYEAIEKYGVLPIHRRSFKLFKQPTLF